MKTMLLLSLIGVALVSLFGFKVACSKALTILSLFQFFHPYKIFAYRLLENDAL